MLKKILLLPLFCLFFILQGCDSSVISLVKESTLSYDNSIPVGKLLESYQYISDPEWTETETDRGQKLVIFKAKCDVAAIYLNDIFYGIKTDYPKEFIQGLAEYMEKTPVYLYIEFKIANDSKSFEFSYLGLDVNGEIKSTRNSQNIEKDFIAIYKNKPVMLDITSEAYKYIVEAAAHSAAKNVSYKDIKTVKSYRLDKNIKELNMYGKTIDTNYIIFSIKELKENSEGIIATIHYAVTNIEMDKTNWMTRMGMPFEEFEKKYKEYGIIHEGEWNLNLTDSFISDGVITLKDAGFEIEIGLRRSLKILDFGCYKVFDSIQEIVDVLEKERKEK